LKKAKDDKKDKETIAVDDKDHKENNGNHTRKKSLDLSSSKSLDNVILHSLEDSVKTQVVLTRQKAKGTHHDSEHKKTNKEKKSKHVEFQDPLMENDKVDKVEKTEKSEKDKDKDTQSGEKSMKKSKHIKVNGSEGSPQLDEDTEEETDEENEKKNGVESKKNEANSTHNTNPHSKDSKKENSADEKGSQNEDEEAKKKKHKHKKPKSVEYYYAKRSKVPIEIVNPPVQSQSQKRMCLVLDIDFTLYDHKSDFEKAPEYSRPYLHEFLSVCHQHYDLVIWSATAMTHITTKLTNMGVLSNSSYKISVILNKDHMIPYSIANKTHTKTRVHDIKPLQIIWSRFPDIYTPKNTIHIDDIIENFALNPNNGLQISPFKDAPTSKANDRELWFLTQYLLLLKDVEDVRELDHKKWKEHIIQKMWASQTLFSMPPIPN